MFSDSKNKNFYFLVLILLLIIAIMTTYNFLYLQEIDKNKDIKVINEVTEVKEIEKKIAIPCIKCHGANNKHFFAIEANPKSTSPAIDENPKQNIPKENPKLTEAEELLKKEMLLKEPNEKFDSLPISVQKSLIRYYESEQRTQKAMQKTSTHIQEINGVKHHHYIVPDSEFKDNGLLNNDCDDVFQRDLKPTLMHSFIKKLNPNYRGWVCHSPSFNENNNNVRIRTEIKYPPFDLVGIYFDKGTRFSGDDDNKDDWDKYTFDEVVKATNGAENVYYFWRTPNMLEKYLQKMTSDSYYKYYYNSKQHPQSNKPHCPPFAKVLTQEDIDNL